MKTQGALFKEMMCQPCLSLLQWLRLQIVGAHWWLKKKRVSLFFLLFSTLAGLLQVSEGFEATLPIWKRLTTVSDLRTLRVKARKSLELNLILNNWINKRHIKNEYIFNDVLCESRSNQKAGDETRQEVAQQQQNSKEQQFWQWWLAVGGSILQ